MSERHTENDQGLRDVVLEPYGKLWCGLLVAFGDFRQSPLGLGGFIDAWPPGTACAEREEPSFDGGSLGQAEAVRHAARRPQTHSATIRR